MFEKEAEEYNQKVPFKPLNVEKEICRAFQKGAEFGYNKANEWHYVKDGINPTHSYRVLEKMYDDAFDGLREAKKVLKDLIPIVSRAKKLIKE